MESFLIQIISLTYLIRTWWLKLKFCTHSFGFFNPALKSSQSTRNTTFAMESHTSTRHQKLLGLTLFEHQMQSFWKDFTKTGAEIRSFPHKLLYWLTSNETNKAAWTSPYNCVILKIIKGNKIQKAQKSLEKLNYKWEI